MRTALADLLAAEDYRVLTAADGERGLERALAEKPDLILLDIMMPKLDGFAVCAELRRLANAVPVLMLTAKGQIEDRVNGLDAGADDYLVKPFSTENCWRACGRCCGAWRRLRRAAKAQARRRGNRSGAANRGARQTKTPSDRQGIFHAALLAEAKANRSRANGFLMWSGAIRRFPTTRTVDNHIASLRAKLENNPDEPRWIKTVHGVGYKLETDV